MNSTTLEVERMTPRVVVLVEPAGAKRREDGGSAGGDRFVEQLEPARPATPPAITRFDFAGEAAL